MTKLIVATAVACFTRLASRKKDQGDLNCTKAPLLSGVGKGKPTEGRSKGAINFNKVEKIKKQQQALGLMVHDQTENFKKNDPYYTEMP